MKPRRPFARAVGAATILVGFGAPLALSAPPIYIVEDLRSRLGHPHVSFATPGNTGDFGGQLSAFGGDSPFVYDDGQLFNLGELSFGAEVSVEGGWIFGMNDRGQFVGSYNPSDLPQDGHIYYPLVYRDGVVDPFFARRGEAGHAVDVNQRGDVLGYFYSIPLTRTAFVYGADGTFELLDSLVTGPGVSVTAAAFNEHGQIAGTVSDQNDQPATRAFVYDDGTVTWLNAPTNTMIGVTDINDAGQIVGYYRQGEDEWHAFLYQEGSFTSLPLQMRYTMVADLSEAGDILLSVRMDAPISTFHAHLYTDGALYDLNDWLAPGSDVEVAEAFRMNELGQITALARRGNEFIPVLLTPIPEPSISTTMLTAALLWSFKHRR